MISHSDRCELICSWFWFAFLRWISSVKNVFMCLLAICISSSEKCLCKSSAHFFLIFKIIFIFWLRCTACRILVPWSGVKPMLPAVQAQSLNHCTAGKSLLSIFGLKFLSFWYWVVWADCVFWIRSDQSLSRVRLFATPWIAAHRASLYITNSQSSPRLTSIKSVMPSSHLILCRPLLLLPPIPPSIRVFSIESTFRIRCPKYWSFSFSIIPSKEIPGLISFRMDWLDLLAVQGTLKNLLQHHSSKHQFFGTQPSSQSNSHIHTWPQEKP